MNEGYRRYRRYPIFVSAVLQIRDTDNTKQLNVQVNNISQGGMGLYTQIPIELATPVTIELSFQTMEDTEKRDILEGSIASLTRDEYQYFVGISFDRDLTHEQFMKLLQWD